MRDRQKKRLSRGRKLARRAWRNFQGRHDPCDHQALEECALCDGEGCRFCEYAGIGIGAWYDLDDHPTREMQGNSKVVQDTNGNPCEGRFKGWDGKRASLR